MARQFLGAQVLIRNAAKFVVVPIKSGIQLVFYVFVYVIVSGCMLLVWNNRIQQSHCYRYEASKKISAGPNAWLAEQHEFSDKLFLEAEKAGRPTIVYVRPIFSLETSLVDTAISNSTSFQSFVAENQILVLVYNSDDARTPSVGSLTTLHGSYKPRLVVTTDRTSKQFAFQFSGNCFELRQLL